MQGKLADAVAKPFNTEFPEGGSLEEYIELLLPKMRVWGEDLSETQFFVEKHWIEIRDNDNFHRVHLHIFNPDGEYLLSKDGKLSIGSWRTHQNKLIISVGQGAGLVYELAFLDGEFFILKLHGDHYNDRDEGYLALIVERLAGKFTWRESMQYLYNGHRGNNNVYYLLAIIIILVIVMIMALSTL